MIAKPLSVEDTDAGYSPLDDDVEEKTTIMETPKETNKPEEKENMFDKMRRAVYDYVVDHLDKSDDTSFFTIDDVYIVWSCKILQNWKCLISTTLPDGMYYECTYNGDRKKLYLDAYKKFDNKTLDI